MLKQDSAAVYQALMQASRSSSFYGSGRVKDNYEGRLDMLAMHISVVLGVLETYGEQGRRLGQAITDVMIDDFDVALREEGFTDSGVKRRIKPMVAFVFTRMKMWDEILAGSDLLPAKLHIAEADKIPEAEYEAEGLEKGVIELSSNFLQNLADYQREFKTNLETKRLGQIARGQFTIPELLQKQAQASLF